VSGPLLLADVGGTNVRFAMSRHAGQIENVCAYAASSYPQFSDALGAYLAEVTVRGCSLAGVRIAAAGPVEQGFVDLTNLPWRIEVAAIEKQVAAPVRLLNDLEAVAAFLPYVRDRDVTSIGADWRIGPPATRLAINIGTGFGAATAHHIDPGGWAITASEAGHMTLGPGAFSCWRDDAELRHAVEDFLSGPSLVAWYRRRLGNAGGEAASAAQVFAQASSNPRVAKLVDDFTQALGCVAGNLALAYAAWGGVFLCGSVVNGWKAAADAAAFRAAFCDKGKMRHRMTAVPTWQLVVPNPALLGLSYTA